MNEDRLSGRRMAIVAAAIALVLVLAGALRFLGSDSSDDDDERLTVQLDGVAGSTTTVSLPQLTVPPAPQAIPGLIAANIQRELTDEGFECGPSPDFQSEGHVIVDCAVPGGTASVRTYATLADEVVAMEAFAFATADDRWMVYLATRPWTGADPAAAEAWVEQTVAAGGAIGSRQSTTIGGQPFDLDTSGADTWHLHIGVEPFVT